MSDWLKREILASIEMAAERLIMAQVAANEASETFNDAETASLKANFAVRQAKDALDHCTSELVKLLAERKASNE
jgi:hypothetical protein